MGFSIGTGVPVITVFIQGLLSFFSPCVLPLVPLYISYLAGGAKTVDENGRVTYPRRRVMVNTLFLCWESASHSLCWASVFQPLDVSSATTGPGLRESAA